MPNEELKLTPVLEYVDDLYKLKLNSVVSTISPILLLFCLIAAVQR